MLSIGLRSNIIICIYNLLQIHWRMDNCNDVLCEIHEYETSVASNSAFSARGRLKQVQKSTVKDTSRNLLAHYVWNMNSCNSSQSNKFACTLTKTKNLVDKTRVKSPKMRHSFSIKKVSRKCIDYI